MSIPLKQSTASQEVLIGPFLDDTDGKTPETGLTIANTDIKLWFAGGTSESSKNSGGATHVAAGRFYTVLDATDTATLGPMEINVHVAGALPVRRECVVMTSAAYDALVGTTAPLTAAVIAAAVWDRLTSALTTVGSIGKLLVDNIDAAISSVGGGAAPTAEEIADMVATRGSANWENDVEVGSIGQAALEATHKSNTTTNVGYITVRNAADSADLYKRAITTNTTAEPLTGVGARESA